MMNVDELEEEIKKGKTILEKLNNKYEIEEDEKKRDKIEFQLSRQDELINKLIDRQQKLLDREARDEEKEDPKDKNAEEEDTDVCENCGGDLVLIGKDENGVDIYECEKCGELFLDE